MVYELTSEQRELEAFIESSNDNFPGFLINFW